MCLTHRLDTGHKRHPQALTFVLNFIKSVFSNCGHLYIVKHAHLKRFCHDESVDIKGHIY